MGSLLPFQISKRATEDRLYNVEFVSDSGSLTINFVTMKVTDSTGADVTSTLINAAYTSFSDNVAQFMATAGTAGQQYTVTVTANLTDGEQLVAEGLLTVI